MSYEEEVIDGVLHWRSSTSGKWAVYRGKDLSNYIEALETRNGTQKDVIKALEERIAVLEEHIDVIRQNPSATVLHKLYESLEANTKLGFTRIKYIIRSNSTK